MTCPFPSATPTWHNDTYPAISPSRPELSVAGKTVVLTGAGSGIGREIAFAFASAGAKQLILLGRNEANLTETKNRLPSGSASCSIYSVSVTDEKALKDIAASVGTWDVLILNAGYLAAPAPVAQTSLEDWWQSFETNVKGTMVMARAFLPTASLSHAAILGVSAAGITVPPTAMPGLSAYVSSKLAQAKILEFLAAENPNIFIASVHPGVVETAMLEKSALFTGALSTGALPTAIDNVRLPAHFMVWMVSPEAAFLKGRVAWVNWDVDELKSQAQEIQSGQQMTSGIIGWPFPHVG